MNSKLFINEEGKIKIDNFKNIALYDIINKKKKFKGFRDGKDFSYFNQKSKHQYNKINNNQQSHNSKANDNSISRIANNQINKNIKIAKLSLELFA